MLALGRALADECPLSPVERAPFAGQILSAGQKPWSFAPLPKISGPYKPAPLPLAQSDERRHIIRRATFVLTGLPPRADDVAAFMGDTSPHALEKAITRLQGSPAHSQRLAENWLRAIGYADHWPDPAPPALQPAQAWRYRDWLVKTLGEKPRWDVLTRLHLAGDAMPASNPLFRAGLTATTWFIFGETPRGDFAEASMRLAGRQAERTARRFLALDLTCARCHDHPSLPLRSEEADSFVAIFAHSHALVRGAEGAPALAAIPTVPQATLDKHARELAAVQAEEKKLATLRDEFTRAAAAEFLPQTAEYIRAAWAWSREPRGSMAEFSAQRGLSESMLARWLNVLGGGPAGTRPALEAPWWPHWEEARASGSASQIAEAARAIQQIHTADAASPFYDPSPAAAVFLSLDQQTQLTRLERKIAELRRKMPDTYAVHALSAGPPEGLPAPEVPPRLPAVVINSAADLAPPDSGRKALADWLTGPGTPFAARLAAVRAAQDLGLKILLSYPELALWSSERPTGAEIIDEAAARFAASGHAPAALQKFLLLKDLETTDPLRMDADEHRDAILFATGELDPLHHAQSDPSPETRRRSLYREWPRETRPPLTEEWLAARAAVLARLAAEKSGNDPAVQLTYMTYRLFQRPPTEAERQAFANAASPAAFAATLLRSEEFRTLP